MSRCGVCGRIITDKDDGLACDGGYTKWYHCTCVGIMHEQYQEYDEDHRRQNALNLKWFCHSCQDQDKGITQRNIYSIGQDERREGNHKKSQSGI